MELSVERLAAVFFRLLVLAETSWALRCYHCASQLPADTPKDAKAAAKQLLLTRYRLPPVHSACGDAELVDFATVPTKACDSEDDRCAKLHVRYEELSFTMRGCESGLFRRASERASARSGSAPCHFAASPSFCLCAAPDRCNDATSLSTHSPYIFASLAMILLATFAL